MKGIFCQQWGAPEQLVWEEVPTPVPASDEVVIQVSHCGVNFPDTLLVQGKYQFKPAFPFSPGGEVAGTVATVGSAVTGFKPGDRVLAGMGWGGFAEMAVAKASSTFRVPQGVAMAEAACLLETYATALHALKDRAQMKAGEVLVVAGAAGGTGMAAVQLGQLFGAKVIAVASTPEKRELALRNGAEAAFAPEEAKEGIKALGGADVIFDPVGGSLSETLFRTMKKDGRHLVVGFASGEIPAIPLNLPLLKSAAILGVFWGQFWREEPEENRKNVRLLLRWLAEGKIQPQISAQFPLQEASKALRLLMDRKVLGKVVLEVEGL